MWRSRCLSHFVNIGFAYIALATSIRMVETEDPASMVFVVEIISYSRGGNETVLVCMDYCQCPSSNQYYLKTASVKSPPQAKASFFDEPI